MANHQLSLSLIPHQVDNNVVEQRAADGYINATAMCKACGKQFGHYRANSGTDAFLDALSLDIGIPISKLIQVVRGANLAQGTWVHPQVAINLAQWLSPRFAVMVSSWVFDWMSGKIRPAKLPYHLQRHVLNNHKIPADKFSVLQEMSSFLLGPMESVGYSMPEDLMPDISQALLFCKMLRDEFGLDTGSLEKYEHEFPDGRKVQANLYPIEYLAHFRSLMAKEWMPNRAEKYFRERDPEALLALDKLLTLTYDKPKKPGVAANKPKLKRGA